MKKFFLISIIFLTIFIFGCAEQEIKPVEEGVLSLGLVAEGFTSPVKLVASPDNTGRLFIVDRVGVIKILMPNNTLVDEPFIDLREKMIDLRTGFDERGLLGLVFHPNFNENKRFYVYYSGPLREGAPDGWDHTAHISEFMVSENANIADINSEKIILQVDEPQFNHDGGDLTFGPDNYLYISLGDGGDADDVGLGHPEIGNGQDITTLLGSILRIDVDNGNPYVVPKDNPFVGKEGRDEIFAYGFRNPFRMSFDGNLLFVGDVGQNLWEEVDIVEKGKNYGWNLKEGMRCFSKETPDKSPLNCPDKGHREEQLIEPIIEYKNAGEQGGVGLSVIGGHVYRGSMMPEMQGKYIFGDWSSSFSSPQGIIFIAEETDSKWSITKKIQLNSFILGFGEDSENELYVLTSDKIGPTGNTGKVYKLR